MSDFGRDDPHEMPAHFFYRSVRVDYGSAVRATPERQNCSVCPRHWYVDMIFPCDRCGGEFAFTAAEQRVWYEEYGFWIDSLPKHCLECRRELRELKAARRDYDRWVEQALQTDDLELKNRLANVIDELYELGGELPARVNEKRRRLARQIARSDPSAP
jgi:Probable zinc-ribbon domain